MLAVILSMAGYIILLSATILVVATEVNHLESNKQRKDAPILLSTNLCLHSILLPIIWVYTNVHFNDSVAHMLMVGLTVSAGLIFFEATQTLIRKLGTNSSKVDYR